MPRASSFVVSAKYVMTAVTTLIADSFNAWITYARNMIINSNTQIFSNIFPLVKAAVTRASFQERYNQMSMTSWQALFPFTPTPLQMNSVNHKN